MVKGNLHEFIKIICNCLQNAGYEWQVNYKDIKFKCRSKFTEADLWDDMCGDFLLEEYFKNEFIKFYLQVFKWSKDLPDCFYLDV